MFFLIFFLGEKEIHLSKSDVMFTGACCSLRTKPGADSRRPIDDTSKYFLKKKFNTLIEKKLYLYVDRGEGDKGWYSMCTLHFRRFLRKLGKKKTKRPQPPPPTSYYADHRTKTRYKTRFSFSFTSKRFPAQRCTAATFSAHKSISRDEKCP